jgi:hypothetical protein
VDTVTPMIALLPINLLAVGRSGRVSNNGWVKPSVNHTKIILANMDTLTADSQGDVDSIIYKKRDAEFLCYSV